MSQRLGSNHAGMYGTKGNGGGHRQKMYADQFTRYVSEAVNHFNVQNFKLDMEFWEAVIAAWNCWEQLKTGEKEETFTSATPSYKFWIDSFRNYVFNCWERVAEQVRICRLGCNYNCNVAEVAERYGAVKLLKSEVWVFRLKIRSSDQTLFWFLITY